MKTGGNQEIQIEIALVTPHQFKVVNKGVRNNQEATYRWIARGVKLVETNP